MQTLHRQAPCAAVLRPTRARASASFKPVAAPALKPATFGRIPAGKALKKASNATARTYLVCRAGQDGEHTGPAGPPALCCRGGPCDWTEWSQNCCPCKLPSAELDARRVAVIAGPGGPRPVL